MTVRLPVVTDRLAQFSLFLNEARKLVARLSAELTLYFFNTHPGLVSVSEFQSRTSVTVLSELLIEISRKAESRW
jgi:hypothetical protein